MAKTPTQQMVETLLSKLDDMVEVYDLPIRGQHIGLDQEPARRLLAGALQQAVEVECQRVRALIQAQIVENDDMLNHMPAVLTRSKAYTQFTAANKALARLLEQVGEVSP